MISPDRPPFLRRAADEWLIIGLLGALLGLGLLFVHVPASLWAGNTTEFHWRFGTFLRLGLAALGTGLVITCVVLALLPRTARAVAAALLCAIGVIAWLYAFFLAGHMTALNGIDAPMDFDTRLGAWELWLAAGAGLLIALAIARARRAAIAALLVLNLGLSLATADTVRSAHRLRVRAAAIPDTAPLFRFSTRDNVLVILLDGLQSDVVDGILRNDPRLKTAFDGFHFYRNTLGVAPTTFLSVPAIHSGTVYRRPERLGEYFEKSIRLQSFMSRFADAGYDTALVNPVEAVCPDRLATCITSAQVLRTGEAQFRSESLRLFDVSLFRLAPVWLKQRIYARGNWFLAGRFDMAEETSRIFEHNLLLDEMARRITVDDGAPTLKFVHSLATHTPFVLNADCRTLGESSQARMAPQARCALLATARLLKAIDAAHVYDRTEIALVADHGIGQVNRYIADTRHLSPRLLKWARRVGYANPTFLLKPRGARGEIRDDDASVYLPDVGATLCASSHACEVPVGAPVGHAPPDRARRFLEYEWRHEFWQLREIPDMATYEVRGALWDVRSWRRMEEAPVGEVKSGN